MCKKMTKQVKAEIKGIAERCVEEMGDIFWDRDSFPGAQPEYADPLEIANASIEHALLWFAERHGISLANAPRTKRNPICLKR